ncbi:MAG TPA: dTMP kinase [Candidatus Saccharimonadales bacterium]|nr:dTMP kinase [Candidatus Saccharimonadales bacterium]
MRGKYIVIEGGDGTGKSTQVQLLRDRLTARGISSIEFHEPQGTPIADEIRTIIKNGNLPRDGKTNLLLFTAARHEIWHRAQKALEKGDWVIAARNYFSTLAYQGYGEGLDLDLITSITEQFTDRTYMNPDLAVILTLDDETERKKRIGQRGILENPDTFESRAVSFQQALQQGYLDIARERGLRVISAAQSPEEICTIIERSLFTTDGA